MRSAKYLFVVLFLTIGFHAAQGNSEKRNVQVGGGLGFATPTSPIGAYALTAILEGTMRLHPVFGVSILATATSSPSVGGTYSFTNGGKQQTFLEPRLYLKILHIGFAVGLDLSSGSSGTMQGIVSYGPSAGIELPINQFSLGVDARYLMNSSASAAPLTLLGMVRFYL